MTPSPNGLLSLRRAWGHIRVWLLSTAVYLLFRTLKGTWNKKEHAFPEEIQKLLDENKPVLVAHWHEDEWALLGVWADKGAHTLVSLSEDGGVMTRFLKLFGWNVARGSSSKGGAAGLLSLIKSVKRSAHPVVTMAVDGPRGPRRRAKKGIFKLAVTLHAPVLVMAAAAKHRIVFKKSWSHGYIPLPFSKVIVCYPGFLTFEEIDRALAKNDEAEIVYKLEESLKAAKRLATQSLNS